MSKLFKALIIVAMVWVVLYFVQDGFTSWLPGMFHFNFGFSNASRDEVLNQTTDGLSGITLETHNGTVALHGSDRQGIELRVHYTANSTSSGRAADLVKTFKTDLTAVGDQLMIKANFGENNYNNNGAASYELFLPQNLSVDVKTSNSSVTVENMAKAAKVDTSNATVTVSSSQGMGTVDIDTSNATVNVSVPQGMEQLTVNTSNSKIEVNGNPDGGNWHLQTSNSRISVALPASLGVNLDAQTSNSSIDVGSGSWSLKGGNLSSKQVNATRGDGALELFAHTTNSEINISDR